MFLAFVFRLQCMFSGAAFMSLLLYCTDYFSDFGFALSRSNLQVRQNKT